MTLQEVVIYVFVWYITTFGLSLWFNWYAYWQCCPGLPLVFFIRDSIWSCQAASIRRCERIDWSLKFKAARVNSREWKRTWHLKPNNFRRGSAGGVWQKSQDFNLWSFIALKVVEISSHFKNVYSPHFNFLSDGNARSRFNFVQNYHNLGSLRKNQLCRERVCHFSRKTSSIIFWLSNLVPSVSRG